MVRAGLEETEVARVLPPLARARLETGDSSGARELIEQAVRRARSSGDRIGLIEALIVEGVSRARAGLRGDAQAAFSEAVVLAEPIPYPYGTARALYEWGVALLDWNHPEAAGPKLEKALRAFQKLGARGYVERTERALAALPALSPDG